MNGSVYFYSLRQKQESIKSAKPNQAEFPSTPGIPQIIFQAFLSPPIQKDIPASKFQLFWKPIKEPWSSLPKLDSQAVTISIELIWYTKDH